MENDIYIRRISGFYETPEKTATELFKFMSKTFDELQKSNEWGEIDYLVTHKTKLSQNDFIGFMAFKNRKLHLDIVNELKGVQPINFKNRGMLFELNCKKTSPDLQNDNRRRFENYFKPVLPKKRYFEVEETLEPNRKITKPSYNAEAYSTSILPSTSRSSLDFIQLKNSQDSSHKTEGTETEIKLKRELQKRNLEYVALEVKNELLKQELEAKNELVNRLLKEREETSELLLNISNKLSNKP
ncbi:unnamed protein product [Brachionus calyciflorus]|uniref:Uncharacterized protein n=1 Tax=Brachionus calyciflorus TaxID=104777 RepID=A0A814NRD5_9BILA|nr:unnamed protein product [Brachionus calyciflorus]